MLDAFRYLLCSKLCWHNRPVLNTDADANSQYSPILEIDSMGEFSFYRLNIIEFESAE